MRVLMTGGGTAGHVNPAIAIANTIKRHHPDAVIEFVCSTLKSDKAQDLVVRAGYELHKVDIRGSHKIYDPRNLKTLYYMIKSAGQARSLIDSFKPNVIIGTGGFACYPILNAGAKLGIPTLVHESNAIAGKAVKRLCSRVDCVMTNFQSTADDLKGAKRVIRVGNPSVFDNKRSFKTVKSNSFCHSVISFGGSGGSETFNDGVVTLLSSVADSFPDIEFYHASGKRDFDRMKAKFAQAGLDKKKNIVLTDYIYDMDERMSAADLVICRAGAMTISELALLGKTAIFVPSPYVAENHQYKNAKAIYDMGACELVEEKEFSSGRLTAAVEGLLRDPELCRRYGTGIRAFADKDANENIYNEIMRLI